MSLRLRDLIKNVRGCRTAAEERDVVAKESARIRTSLKENENEYRQRNIAKLLYFNMLGYNTSFAQMECLKLVVSQHYSEKRLGYLALMLLLDESQEVLMLVTNSLKGDLFHANHFIVGLALCALANIASAEMARDTSPEVEKLLQSTNSYIRKKAALCAVRIIRKEPELAENFVQKIRALLSERNHGVLLTGVTLMIELLKYNPASITEFRQLVPNLVRILKGLVMSGYAPEHDVGGITDPFLQIKILRVLRDLGKGDAEASEQMSDILAQVATNTENNRNVGNAVLYECVQTIMSIESEQGLKVLAINVLGRFLLVRDNNIRYVALNTLARVVAVDLAAVQRHRDTIVDCLKDPDVSIRRRSLEIIYALVNESNVKTLVRELLNFLLVSDVEFRADLVARLTVLINQFAPSKKWQLDTMIRVMIIAGNNYLPDEVPSMLIALISQSSDLQSYAVLKLFSSMPSDTSSQAFLQVALWVVGEYGNLLVNQTMTTANSAGETKTETVSESMILDVVERVLRDPLSTILTRQYALTAIAKLVTRLSRASFDRLRSLLAVFKDNIQIELQQRSVEYTNVINLEKYRASVLEPMPPIEKTISLSDAAPSASGGALAAPKAAAPKSGGGLLELDDLLGPAPTPAAGPATGAGGDALADLLGLGPVSTPSPAAVAPVSSGGGLLDDLLGISTPSPAAPAAGAVPSQVPAYNKAGVAIHFEVKKNPAQPHLTMLNMVARNGGVFDVSNFVFQAAVPKYIKLLLDPPSGNHLAPGGTVTQIVKINNSAHGEKPILMKIKVCFNANGQAVDDLVDVSFPPTV